MSLVNKPSKTIKKNKKCVKRRSSSDSSSDSSSSVENIPSSPCELPHLNHRRFTLLPDTMSKLDILNSIPHISTSSLALNVSTPLSVTTPVTTCWSSIVASILNLTNTVTPINSSNVAGVTDIYDQGALGSCTANAGCALFQYNAYKRNIALKGGPSRLWFYYLERKLMGTTYINQDSGAYMADAICVLMGKSISNVSTTTHYGMLDDYTYWNYMNATDTRTVKTILTTPNPLYNLNATGANSLFTISLNNNLNGNATSSSVYAITTVNPTKNLNSIDTTFTNANLPALYTALNNGPCIIGFNVYSSFYNITPINPVYSGTGSLLGGHAVLIVGYISTGTYSGNFIVQNSWGSSWGLYGFFLVPTSVLTNGNWAGCYTITN